MPMTYQPTPSPSSSSSDTEEGSDFEPSAPVPTDADDSIVLSDLVRTGEASRLRRRGAMRLDHPPAVAQEQALRGTSPTVIVVGESPWGSETDDRDGAGPVFGRSAFRERASISVRGQPRNSRRSLPDEVDEFRYTLFCGHEETGSDLDECHGTNYQPSPLPLYPSNPAASTSSSSRSSRKSSGCGAIIHRRASPRRRLGVWTAKSEASDAVVGLDAAYFDRTAVAKIVTSPCGCIREGVGCAVCGNPLGTRYRPCKTAGEGIFASHPTPSAALQPEGPRYWRAGSYLSSSQSTKRDFYVYTFFSTAVSSSPSYSFPPRPPLTALSQLQPEVSQLPSQTLLQTSAWLGTESRERDVPAYTPLFDRAMSASPTPLSDVGEEDGPTYQGAFLDTNRWAYVERRVQANFDPDGEFIGAEPGSPDKTGDNLILPDP